MARPDEDDVRSAASASFGNRIVSQVQCCRYKDEISTHPIHDSHRELGCNSRHSNRYCFSERFEKSATGNAGFGKIPPIFWNSQRVVSEPAPPVFLGDLLGRKAVELILPFEFQKNREVKWDQGDFLKLRFEGTLRRSV